MEHETMPTQVGLERFAGLRWERAEALLHRISGMRAGVVGDVCLDVYWHADMTLSELSRETPHYPLPVVRETHSPGAGGNVAANLKALGCKEVYVCSVTGRDWRGDSLRRCLDAERIDHTLALTEDDWWTPAYGKPIRHGYGGSYQEDPRLDFHNRSPLSETTALRLVEGLDEMAKRVDVIAVTDQFPYGVVGERLRERLAYWAHRGIRIVADSRDRIGSFRNVVVKPNELETLRWHMPEEDPRKASGNARVDAARRLAKHVGAACCMTLGERGSIWTEGGDLAVWTPSVPAKPPLDIVGAGDCFASALVCALGAGGSGPEAMAFAHLAASVVIHKLGTTGTASPDEIAAAHRETGSYSD